MENFMIVALPKSSELTTEPQLLEILAARYREFRLLALLSDPEAFGAVHAIENLRAPESWLRRLTDAKARYFFAVKHNPCFETDSMLAKTRLLAEVEWYGSLVLLGPQEYQQDDELAVDGDPFLTMTDPGQATSIANRDNVLPFRYHINGMFVRPEARRLGIARKLMDALLAGAQAEAHRDYRASICTVFVDKLNTAASRLYLELGFAIRDQKIYSKRVVVDGEWSEEDRTLLKMSLMAATESHTQISNSCVQ